MGKAGVYAIQNLITGRMYIGSSANMRSRWSGHRSRLRKGVHHTWGLQCDWNHYGEHEFVFAVLEHVDDEVTRINREQFHIDKISAPYNENNRSGSGPKAGYKHSETAKMRMSLAMKGRKKTAEHRAAISAGRSGMFLSETHRKHIGDGLRGGKRNEDTKAKMRIARAKVIVTWGASISASKKGKPWSEARRAACKSLRINALEV